VVDLVGGCVVLHVDDHDVYSFTKAG